MENTRFNIGRNHYILFLIIFTEVLGFSMVIPVLPFLGLSLGLNPFEIGLIISVFSMAQFFSAPTIGKLSDRYGRKPTLIVSQISTIIGFVLLAYTNSVWMLISARLVDGLFGSNLTLTQTVLADITPNKERTRVFGYSSGVFGGGLIFGPAIGGILAEINFSLPFLLAAVITLISLILIIFILPETNIQHTERLKLRSHDIFPLPEIKKFSRTTIIKTALMMLLLYNIAFQVFISNFSLFFEALLESTTSEVGIFLGFIGVLRVIFQTIMIGPLIKNFGEDAILVSGLITMILSMLLLVITANFLFAFLPLAALAYGTGVSRPILTSKLSNTVTQEETGVLLGVNNSIVSLIQIFGPISGGFILTVSPPSTLPIISGLIFSILLMYWLKNRHYDFVISDSHEVV